MSVPKEDMEQIRVMDVLEALFCCKLDEGTAMPKGAELKMQEKKKT